MLRLLSYLTLAFSLGATAAGAQHYPDHPVKVVVGYAAGSGPDIQARTVSAQLSLDLGQQFFVENRTGANGTIGTRAVVQAKPDGYTVLYSSNGIAPTPYIYKNLGYDIFTISRRSQASGFSMVCSCWSTRGHPTKPSNNSLPTQKRTALSTVLPVSGTVCTLQPKYSVKRLASACSTYLTRVLRKS